LAFTRHQRAEAIKRRNACKHCPELRGWYQHDLAAAL